MRSVEISARDHSQQLRALACGLRRVDLPESELEVKIAHAALTGVPSGFEVGLALIAIGATAAARFSVRSATRSSSALRVIGPRGSRSRRRPRRSQPRVRPRVQLRQLPRALLAQVATQQRRAPSSLRSSSTSLRASATSLSFIAIEVSPRLTALKTPFARRSRAPNTSRHPRAIPPTTGARLGRNPRLAAALRRVSVRVTGARI